MPHADRPLTGLPGGLTDAPLFHNWGADALKLYLWLRAHARYGAAADPEPGGLRRGYIVADVPGADLEQAIGVSKNTVTKLARELRDLGVATFHADRAGYHFQLGEWLAYRSAGPAGDLTGEGYYLDSLLAASDRPTQG